MKSSFALRSSRVQHEIVSLLVLARRVGQLRPLENCNQPGVSGRLHRAADGDDFASGVLQFNRHRRFQDRVMDAAFVILLQMRGHDISERDLAAWAEHPLKAEGIDVIGPLSADTMFHAKARARYDVALTMYHDQGLIPVKTLAFDEGVNVTLGLPFVRTSPDHGTAFDIAGKGVANPASLIAALKLADRLTR